MEKRAGGFYFWAVTIILLFVAAFCCAGKAKGKESLSAQERERCYREMEEELMSGTRELLRMQGLENSGVMLTRVVENEALHHGEDIRQYTLTVHHGGIDRMSEAERAALMAELKALAADTYERCVGEQIGETACTLSHKFFIDD